ncbi:hypothetical protein GHT06_020233 [Daphnia sinensis]|uniref:Reverse transcriptase domain-containing protein n=1 Tax=Daphnia sinensis TaxID=1820382 RepID=A0AAD5KL61_9CRUS|nr:hypothetical protein GHT06_020233 [Daphnia sinensis]
MIRETKFFYQSCIQEMAEADTFDWVAFHQLRKFSKSWEESTLKGYGIRSCCFEGQELEKANIFHVNRARVNYRKCCIDKIIASNGTCLSTKEDISGEILSHFSKIFKNQSSPDILAGTDFLEGVRDCFKPTPNLTAPISLPEIRAALMAMKSNKSPGTDGIPYEFYVEFWDVIAPHFLGMFNHILERESLTSSQGQAAIRLIPKSSGPCGISNFRPISLLNCDYKVMASVLARRLRDVIQFVDDRGCHDSSNFPIRGMGAAIVGVDLEKAYDLVNREVLWRILDVMGYPTTFVRWLQTMYSGISLFNEKLTVRAFVDDVTIFISCDEDFTRAGQVLDLFCQWTKARMNKEKTKALGLGTWCSRLTWPLEWLVSAPTLSLLGIKFSHSIVETADRVWNDAFGYLNGILRKNACRRFNLYQRVIFLKSKALSGTVFIAQVLPCKQNMADQILKAVMKFLWI